MQPIKLVKKDPDDKSNPLGWDEIILLERILSDTGSYEDGQGSINTLYNYEYLSICDDNLKILNISHMQYIMDNYKIYKPFDLHELFKRENNKGEQNEFFN